MVRCYSKMKKFLDRVMVNDEEMMDRVHRVIERSSSSTAVDRK